MKTTAELMGIATALLLADLEAVQDDAQILVLLATKRIAEIEKAAP